MKHRLRSPDVRETDGLWRLLSGILNSPKHARTYGKALEWIRRYPSRAPDTLRRFLRKGQAAYEVVHALVMQDVHLQREFAPPVDVDALFRALEEGGLLTTSPRAFSREVLRGPPAQEALDQLRAGSRAQAPKWEERELLRPVFAPNQRGFYTSEGMWLQSDITRLRASISAVADDGERAGRCALSGESLEAVYEEELRQWSFRGCARVRGEHAAQLGLLDGSLVQVCAIRDDDLVREIAV